MLSLHKDGYVTDSSDEMARELPTLIERGYKTESSDEDDKEAYPAESNHVEYNLNLGWKWDKEYKINDDSYNCNILPLSLPSYDNDNLTIEPNVKNIIHHELEYEQKLNSDLEVGDQTLASMAIPSNFKILVSLNIWIADTGATIHNIPLEIGLTNARSGTSKDSVTTGNSEKMSSKYIGDIKGTITTKHGQEIARVLLKDVVHVPKSKFNLLFLTKMMNEG